MAARALDPDAQLPAQDLQVQHTLSCPFGHKDQAQAALNQLSEQFSVQQQVCHHVALSVQSDVANITNCLCQPNPQLLT